MKATRKVKKPLIHSLETKLEAVKQINMLMAAGVTKNHACERLAVKYGHTTQTIYNWYKRHNTRLTQITTRDNGKFETLSATPSFKKETGRFSVHSLSIRTVGGAVVKLTPADIKGIAEYATIV